MEDETRMKRTKVFFFVGMRIPFELNMALLQLLFSWRCMHTSSERAIHDTCMHHASSRRLAPQTPASLFRQPTNLLLQEKPVHVPRKTTWFGFLPETRRRPSSYPCTRHRIIRRVATTSVVWCGANSCREPVFHLETRRPVTASYRIVSYHIRRAVRGWQVCLVRRRT